MALQIIPNLNARRIFLDRHGLAESPKAAASGPALLSLIERIGFLQIDSIATVGRAHDMILYARRQNYRPEALKPLLELHRDLWEHWTHDAAILPASLYPHWKHRFAENRANLVKRWTGWQKPGFEQHFDRVLSHIARHGAVSAAELSDETPRGKSGWWDWHPTKAALEYLWLSGEIAITRRDGFRKIYDLSERVIPELWRTAAPPRDQTIDWACRSALDRLGFATAREIMAYWGAVTLPEVKAWCERAVSRGLLCEAMIEGANGSLRRAFLWPSTLTEFPAELPRRVRVLSPFDPALRDRARAEFLFGFAYRIEIYVPEPRRRYGYYVFPLLEGDRIIGRLDAKAWRDANTLRVAAFWPEPGVRLGAGRKSRLEAEMHRLANFAGCDHVEFLAGWDRSAGPIG